MYKGFFWTDRIIKYNYYSLSFIVRKYTRYYFKLFGGLFKIMLYLS